MTEIEREILGKQLAARMTAVAMDELSTLDANEQGAVTMIAATNVAVTFAALRNMDARATLAELNVLAAAIAEDVHRGRL